MLDGAGDDAPGLAAGTHCADEGKIIGFGAAGSEDDCVRLGTDQRGDLCAGGFNGLSGNSTLMMQTRRIAKGSSEKWRHRVEDSGIKRCSGGMIEIDSRHDFLQRGCARLCAPKNTNASSGILGMRQLLTEISCPPRTGRELAPDDQAVS